MPVPTTAARKTIKLPADLSLIVAIKSPMQAAAAGTKPATLIQAPVSLHGPLMADFDIPHAKTAKAITNSLPDSLPGDHDCMSSSL